MHIKKVIEKLGYASGEVEVYLASLNLGASTISDLAEKARLPRTSVQLIVDKLHQAGLMNYFVLKKRKMWVAENPEKLLIELKEREAAITKIMPELQALRYSTGVKPTYRVYQGVEKIKLVWQDILETKHHVSAIISINDFVRVLGRDFLDETVENRYSHFLKLRMLCPKTAETVKMQERDSSQMRQTRFLPQTISIKNINFIYANKIAVISLSNRVPTAVIIEDQDTADTYLSIFDSLWLAGSVN